MKTFFGVVIRGSIFYILALVLFLLFGGKKMGDFLTSNYLLFGILVCIILIISATLYKIKKFKEAHENGTSQELVLSNSKEVGHEK